MQAEKKPTNSQAPVCNYLVVTRLNQERKAWRQDHPHVQFNENTNKLGFCGETDHYRRWNH